MTWDLNPDSRCGKLAANCLSYGKALNIRDMNAAVLKTWFLRSLHTLYSRQLKNVAIVVNNASCHFILPNKTPKTSSRKYEITD
jgi:hypothetical protein